MRTPEDDPRYARLAAQRSRARRRGDDAGTPARCRIGPRPSARSSARSAPADAGASCPGLATGVAAAAAVLFFVGWRGLPPGRDRRDERSRPAQRCAGGDGARRRRRRTAPACRSRRPAAFAPPARGDRIAAGASVRVAGRGPPPARARHRHAAARRRFVGDARDRARRHAALRPRQRHAGGRGRQASDGRALRDRDRRRRGRGEGTRFEVAVVPDPSSCAPFVRTQVVVHEGVVAVRFGGGEVRLPAGLVWPTCPPAAAAPPPARRARPARAHAAPAAAVAAPPRSDPSTLAAQNDLFAAALAARRRGENDRSDPLARSADRALSGRPVD